MPPAELSASQIEQAGRLLMPMFLQGVRTELESLRADMADAMGREAQATARRFVAVEDQLKAIDLRLQSLEKLKAKALMAWSLMVLGASSLTTLAWQYIKLKLFS